MARLALLGMVAKAAYAYRDERKRKELVSKAKDIADKAKTEINKAKSKHNGGASTWTPPVSMTSTPDIPPSANAGGPQVASMSTPSTPAFSSLDLSDRTVSATEIEVIAEVTRAFPESSVRADAVAVHRRRARGRDAAIHRRRAGLDRHRAQQAAGAVGESRVAGAGSDHRPQGTVAPQEIGLALGSRSRIWVYSPVKEESAT